MSVITHIECVRHTVTGKCLIEDEGTIVCTGILFSYADPVELVSCLLDSLNEPC